MLDKLEVLEKTFGYRSFLPGQQRAVDCLLSGRDCLGVMPTGGGKSICYQLPALCLPGITVVVSPLISLMKDQVESLIQSGVPAAYLNRSLTERQYQLALQRAEAGWYKIIYVAPERLQPRPSSASPGTPISVWWRWMRPTACLSGARISGPAICGSLNSSTACPTDLWWGLLPPRPPPRCGRTF